jgi:hypothetical protein
MVFGDVVTEHGPMFMNTLKFALCGFNVDCILAHAQRYLQAEENEVDVTGRTHPSSMTRRSAK